jgi:hypothetical protein
MRSALSHKGTTMTYEEFRQEMNDYREHLIKGAAMAKEMNLVWMNLHKLYLKFNQDERSLADQVVSEWLTSEDAGQRSDAEYLIEHCNIRDAKAPLEALARRLSETDTPLSPTRFELEKVQRIIAKIEK